LLQVGNVLLPELSAVQLGIIIWAWGALQLGPVPEAWQPALLAKCEAEGYAEGQLQVQLLL
jgi:hypothetical protein